MNTFILSGITVVMAVLIQYAFPGRALYHYGWYNVAIVALIVITVMQLRKLLKDAPARRARAGLVGAAFGVAVVGIAGVTSGLLAPETQTVIGAPGQSIRLDELGRPLDFPLLENVAASPLQGTHVKGGFLLRSVPRTIVAVDVYDQRGAHLTITQPTGTAFLSPVLLMQTTQTIAGMTLPFDSFSVPAARRVVKTVLFSPQEAAQLPALGGSPSAAVLFDVENAAEAQLPHGIAFAHDGEQKTVAGLQLRPTILSYPAIEIIAIPNVYVVLFGLIALVVSVGLKAAALRTPSYS